MPRNNDDLKALLINQPPLKHDFLSVPRMFWVELDHIFIFKY